MLAVSIKRKTTEESTTISKTRIYKPLNFNNHVKIRSSKGQKNQVSNYNTFSVIDSNSFVEFTINGNNFSGTFYNDNTTNLSNGSYTLEITANGTATSVQSYNTQLLTD